MRHNSNSPDNALVLKANKELEAKRQERAKALGLDTSKALALVPNHIALCIDISGSMGAYFPDRYSRERRVDVANSGVKAIVSASDPAKTAYTLIGIDSTARILVPKTTSYMQIQTMTFSDGGGTDGVGALKLAKQGSPTRIVVLTDGEWYLPDIAFEVAVSSPKIPIDTIAIGEGNDDFLKKLSEITGGVFKRVNSKEEMKQHFIALEPRNYLRLTHGG